MEGHKIGYTTWGNFRGGCGHIHETLEDGIACLETDRSRVSFMGDGLRADRWLYRMVLYPGGEIILRRIPI